jgi:hypothetical protein
MQDPEMYQSVNNRSATFFRYFVYRLVTSLGALINRPIVVDRSCLNLPHTFEIRTGISLILRPCRLPETQKVGHGIQPEPSQVFIYLFVRPVLMHCFVLLLSISTI